jgi:hypothetical protein
VHAFDIGFDVFLPDSTVAPSSSAATAASSRRGPSYRSAPVGRRIFGSSDGMVSHAGARPLEDQPDTFVRPAEFCEDDLPIG